MREGGKRDRRRREGKWDRRKVGRRVGQRVERTEKQKELVNER